MNTYLNMTKIALEEKGILYNEFNERTIGVGFTNGDGSHLNFSFQFDNQETDCEEKANHLHVSTFIENCNMRSKYSQALMLCNNLNQEYRWAKFYVDKDYDVACDADAILSDDAAGDECIELMFRLMTIIDEVIPRVMHLNEFEVTIPTTPATENYS